MHNGLHSLLPRPLCVLLLLRSQPALADHVWVRTQEPVRGDLVQLKHVNGFDTDLVVDEVDDGLGPGVVEPSDAHLLPLALGRLVLRAVHADVVDVETGRGDGGHMRGWWRWDDVVLYMEL